MSGPHRWPLELGHLTGTGEPIAVTVVSDELDDGSLRLSVDLPDTSERLVTEDSEAGAALPALRFELETRGRILYCNAFRRDAVLSGMANGLSCYLRTGNRNVRPSDRADSLGPAPHALVVTAAEAQRISVNRDKPGRRLAAATADLLDRWRPDVEETRREALEKRLDGDVWLERTGAPTEPQNGVVYRAELIGGSVVFGLVVGVSESAATLHLYSFVAATTDAEPSALFIDENLTAARFTVEDGLWRGGYLTALDAAQPVPSPAGTGDAEGEPMTVGAFSRAIFDELDLVPF